MIDNRRIEDLILQVGKEKILPRFKSLAGHEIRSKSNNTLVTIADEEAEAALIAGLKDIDPGYIIVGEEGASTQPAILGQFLSSCKQLWLIDPIDGTANYAAGKEIFATMLAYLSQGIIKAGWIYFPYQGEMLSAIEGKGTFFKGKRLAQYNLLPTTPIRGIISGLPKNKDTQSRIQTMRSDPSFVIHRSLRCSAVHYRLLALGEIDFLLSFNTYPWDHAPGLAIVAELGGAADRDFTQRLFDPEKSDQISYVLSAASQKIWNDVHDKVFVNRQ